MAKENKLDLSKLTKEEKLKLIDALDEKKRRQLQARANYIPNAGQLAVHSSEKKLRAVFSGNGGGKTTLAVNEAIWMSTGYNPILKKTTPVPARTIVLLDRPDKVADVWLPEASKWYLFKPEQLHKRGKPYISQITFDNGSEIIFMTHDMDPLAFESLELDFLVSDEPMPRSVFQALYRGGRKKGRTARFLLVGTPISAAWMRKEIWEKWAQGESPDTECFKYGTAVNAANLADDYIKNFGAILSEKEKQIRLHGAFHDLEGLALAHLFNREVHIIPPPRWPNQHPVVVVVDFHGSKPHVACMVGITKDNGLVYLKEFTSRAVPTEYARELRNFYQGYRVIDIVCDSLGSSELTGGVGNESFIAVLRKNGVRIRATTYDEKKDEAFIQMIQEVLAVPSEPDNLGRKEPRLKIASDCKGIINDIESVEWLRYRNEDQYKPKLGISNKDFLACLKYALATQPRFTKGRDRMISPKTSASWNQRELWRKSAK